MKIIKWSLPLAIVTVVYFWSSTTKSSEPKVEGKEVEIKSVDRGLASTSSSPSTSTKKEPFSENPLSESEKKSVDHLASLLADAETSSSLGIAMRLKELGLNPEIGREENEATGRLDIVRTTDALEGTRYFHAQVFDDKTDGSFVQHVSFQVRPGKDSMEVALAAIRQTHRDLGKPQIERPGYVMWRTKEGRIVSAKKLEQEELKDNPFHAQDPEQDVGTVWVVSEDDPDDDGDSDHHSS